MGTNIVGQQGRPGQVSQAPARAWTRHELGVTTFHQPDEGLCTLGRGTIRLLVMQP
jgi:hypothetical protein